MYKNCGAKVKGLASAVATLGMAGAVMVGLVMALAARDASGLFAGILLAAGGSLAAWLGSLLLATFGELVQNSYEILQLMKAGGSGMDAAMLVPKVDVTEEEIAFVMSRDGLPYVDAMIRAKQEKFKRLHGEIQKKPIRREGECPACGAVSKGANFCTKCGAKL